MAVVLLRAASLAFVMVFGILLKKRRESSAIRQGYPERLKNRKFTR